jgi:hypothetical protein
MGYSRRRFDRCIHGVCAHFIALISQFWRLTLITLRDTASNYPVPPDNR